MDPFNENKNTFLGTLKTLPVHCAQRFSLPIMEKVVGPTQTVKKK